ncbi:MAG: Rab family GTPase [Promethearchaeota archaeon]
MEEKTISDKEFVFKIALLGTAGVGKTSLIYRYIDKKFSEDYKPTLGASIIAQDIHLMFNGSRNKIRMVIWDLAGQEKYESVRPMYFQGCIGAILVYDVTRIPTFQEIERKWLLDFKTYAKNGSTYFLIGNKTDLTDLRSVNSKQGQDLADKIGSALFIETSAKTGENVKKCFTSLVLKILEDNDEKL